MTDKIRPVWKLIITIAAGLTAIFGVIDSLFEWGVFSWLGNQLGLIVDFLIADWKMLLLVMLALFVMTIFIRLQRLEKFAPISFKDNFNTNSELKENWHYEGKWEVSKKGELRVTHSHAGGMTRVGQLWTDYSFEFTAVLDEKVVGWIVRAQDLSNYYMIQLTPELIRPHIRFASNWIVLEEVEHHFKIVPNVPIRIRTEVRNIEARIFINDEEIYNNHKLFGTKFIDVQDEGTGSKMRVVVPAFITGRVGFREDRFERARFYRCRVRPL